MVNNFGTKQKDSPRYTSIEILYLFSNEMVSCYISDKSGGADNGR